MKLTEILVRQPKALLTVAGFILVLLIGVLDYIASPYFTTLLLFLVPIIFATWYVGRLAGVLLSISSALIWFLNEVALRHQFVHILVPVWSLVERIGIFFTVIYIVVRLKNEAETSRRLDRERKDMLSMFAHDMKNPLMIINGFLSRLLAGKAGPVTEKQMEYMKPMRDELLRLERYVMDFLELSKFESATYKPAPTVFNIVAALKMRIEMERIMAEKNSINIRFEISEDDVLMVSADAVQIDRVIANLIDNAIKFTAPGGTVTVRLLERGNDVIVQVTDTGIGIREEHIPHLFDAFYRVSRDTKGSGLGLSIAKGIVEANGGKIWVESMLGRGSTFSFTLFKSPEYDVSGSLSR